VNIPPGVAQKPFITGKPHNLGSGLGLHVATEMMHGMRGHLLFLSQNDLDLPQPILNNKIFSTLIALCFPIIK